MTARFIDAIPAALINPSILKPSLFNCRAAFFTSLYEETSHVIDGNDTFDTSLAMPKTSRLLASNRSQIARPSPLLAPVTTIIPGFLSGQ